MEKLPEISPSCPLVHKAWKEILKEWEFCSCPWLIMGMLDMKNCVHGPFCMDDGNMLIGSFFKEFFPKLHQKINNHMNLISPIGRRSLGEKTIKEGWAPQNEARRSTQRPLNAQQGRKDGHRPPSNHPRTQNENPHTNHGPQKQHRT